MNTAASDIASYMSIVRSPLTSPGIVMRSQELRLLSDVSVSPGTISKRADRVLLPFSVLVVFRLMLITVEFLLVNVIRMFSIMVALTYTLRLKVSD